jgi:hypothetical protein
MIRKIIALWPVGKYVLLCRKSNELIFTSDRSERMQVTIALRIAELFNL